MPTISKINPNGGATVYDLKDTSATNSITKIYAGLAPNYDNNTEYSTNDVVIYNGELYKNIQDPNEYIPAGSFNPLYWTKIATAQECQKVANTITSIEFSFTSDYNIGDIVRYNDKLYRFKVYHEWETEWNNSEVEQVDVVGLINEVNGKVGTLSNLKTTAKSDLVSAINEIKGTVYGFYINPNQSDSYEAVTYLNDAVGMTPASMGTTTFNYGSWENAFFMPKPCMLKYDCTVDYYLDPNDYSKKLDGTASDVANLAYDGNAMLEFPLIWYKWEQGATSGEGNFYAANYKVDDTFVCFSNRDCEGNIIEHFYLPIYNGCTYDGKMRSLSGLKLTPWSTTGYSSSSTYAVNAIVNHDGRMYKCTTDVETPEDFDSTKWEQFAFNANTTGEEEITYATANNKTAKVEWYTDVWCDRSLINALLVLIGKCIDTQGTFGRGIDSGGQEAKEAYVTGTLDDKGLFWGSTTDGTHAIKIFGTEKNWWGLEWQRTAGLLGGADNTYLYKMTASTADGSTANGYNATGSGYLTANNRPNEQNWLRKLQFGNFGFLPLEVGSYDTQYYKDHYWTGTGYAIVGGASYAGSGCGAFYVHLGTTVGSRGWYLGAALSCKPFSRDNTAKLVDTALTSIGDVSSLKTTAKSDLVSAINELKGTLYTFHIDPNEADSYEAVTYHDDAVGMTPASMGATSFNYGSWGNAFFMPKPCMLKFDGTVDYYLDPNDYSKKLDGTASDVADLSYPGNAMVEFPLIWWKSWGDGWVSIADYQVDATYKCWSNLDADGNVIPYFYLPIYNGVIYDGKMRSISGIQLKSWSTTAYSNSATYAVGAEVNHNSRMWKCITAVETPEDFDSTKWEQFAFNANTTGEEEITYATANNTTTKVEWYTDVWCDRSLINALLVLIGKCIDTQGTFGRGIDSGGGAAKVAYITGSLDDKGLFYGDISGGSTAGKVFGMENWWSCVWRRIAGLVGGANNTYLYKMTASTTDGTTVKGYNTTGSGYITVSGRPSGHNWLKKMQFGQFGALPLEVGSYSTQYYKDYYSEGSGYALVGSDSGYGNYGGAFCLSLGNDVNGRLWSTSASLSCKPCLIKEAIVNE